MTGQGPLDFLSFARASAVPGAQVRTDAWIGYEPLVARGYDQTAVAVRADHAKTDMHLPMIHIAFGNLAAWLLGTHHGGSTQHLQAYLNEYVFRFNRRIWPMARLTASWGSPCARQRPPTPCCMTECGRILGVGAHDADHDPRPW